MVADIQIPQGLKGDTVVITVDDELGSPDDLTQYLTVTLKVHTMDFSSELVNQDVSSDSNSDGTIDWDPNGALTTPGKYIVSIFREATNVKRPTKTFTLEVERND